MATPAQIKYKHDRGTMTERDDRQVASFENFGRSNRGTCALAGRGTGPGPGQARAEPRAAGGSAGSRWLSGQRLGHRAWARGGPGSRQGGAGQGPARPIYVRSSAARKKIGLLVARRWPLLQRGGRSGDRTLLELRYAGATTRVEH